MSNLKALVKLGKIQQELNVPKNQRNTFGNYNYRSAEDILEALKPLSAKHKVIFEISEELREICGMPYICSEARMTCLETQEYVFAQGTAIIDLTVKGMHMTQRTGAASSYAKKFGFGNLLLIDDSQDSDAVNKHVKTADKKQKPTKQPVAGKTSGKAALKKGMSDTVVANFLKGISEGKFDLVEKMLGKYAVDANMKKVKTALNKAKKG